MADRLNAAFVLGYHGCDVEVAEKLLGGEPFRKSDNDYDWLGGGIYFWEKNPQRALDFARELEASERSPVTRPAVVGAVIDLGLCLDMMTKSAIDQIRDAHEGLTTLFNEAKRALPENKSGGLLRKLDCAVITLLHDIREENGSAPIETVRGVFIEGAPIYPHAGFYEKTHIQICVRDPACIKGVCRVSLA